jgi:hypothetical protein
MWGLARYKPSSIIVIIKCSVDIFLEIISTLQVERIENLRLSIFIII